MEEKKIFYSKNDDPKMIQAYQDAQDHFKFFWRELSWEYRRIIPALDTACVKVAFSQEMEIGEEPIVEHMWINEIEFDGHQVSGVLLNSPNEITNIEEGDFVKVPVTQISDWLFATRGKTYGGYTIQVLRADMSEAERKEHDEAWGLDFGDFNTVMVAYEQNAHPENLIEHPMSRNMGDSLIEFLKTNPGEISSKDELGYTLLHRETIAGNKTSVEVLLASGANREDRTIDNYTALDFAIKLKWDHITELLKK